MHTSIWQNTPLKRFPPLEGDVTTQAAVIGGGMAGLLTAYWLGQRGVKTLVLEAGQIAGGQTGRTTAKITSQHGLIYARLIRQFGRELAAQYAMANQQAIDAYERIIREQGIDCSFSRRGACLFSTQETTPLMEEAEAAASLGLPAAFSRETGLPFAAAGIVRFADQAQFHPLRFLAGIVPALDVREDTRVTRVEGHTIHTDRGRVTAEHIVFAAHFPFVNVPGLYFMRMHQERSYVLALRSGWLPRDMYLGIDGDALSLREAEGLLLLGGGGHRTGENRQGGRYEALTGQARTLFPGSREAARWSAQDCMTLDGVPYIGQYSRSAPDWYVATGFGKWGMTSSMVAAQTIAGMICGETPSWAEVFSPRRFRLSASAQALANETGHAVRGLTRELLGLPRGAADDLPRGHGGIVEAQGRKLGVYKDEQGTLFTVDARCPHLGCQLEWNPDERTWDCPCHGSRFAYDGALLDGPAQITLPAQQEQPEE